MLRVVLEVLGVGVKLITLDLSSEKDVAIVSKMDPTSHSYAFCCSLNKPAKHREND